MSFSGFDDIPEWGVPTPSTGDIVTNAIKKEKLIKEIVAAQDDLRAMLAKTKTVQADVDKLASGNETLQMYIDNLTMQMAKRRGQ
ncbi:hypothetical protein PYCCODRAFT_1463485 [Trametes coccinea BRFM310]|uniref:Uncharacterized protein n=2 Tax=Trametes TaxID=5324 RepID=A0A1Y2J1B6_TRAC3|nr:hypothetical protein FKP32DRAFT_1761857 [Trametes sanguinea]KAJ3000926.1 hypothetical protein NUW54_g6705 [Trametes sanguinea]OSD07186.1 hypothetical protein PYCCODRAFT_1463485 [Trametes coccinea BRFM310]